MIVSVHIPKTAGTTFRNFLRKGFGARLLLDYGDLPGSVSPEATERRQTLNLQAIARASAIEREFDIIHGHFLPAKYQGLFTKTRRLTFVRDPYQHLMSFYLHAQREAHHSLTAQTIMDVATLPSSCQNIYFADGTIDNYDLVGITEEFDLSVALFRKLFDVSAQWDGIRHNANPSRPPTDYQISDEFRHIVKKHREQDIALYRKSKEQLVKLAALYDV